MSLTSETLEHPVDGAAEVAYWGHRAGCGGIGVGARDLRAQSPQGGSAKNSRAVEGGGSRMGLNCRHTLVLSTQRRF